MMYCLIWNTAKAFTIKGMISNRWEFVHTYSQRVELLKTLLGDNVLSPEVVELLCDSYDNGYQILNYFLQYVQVLKEKGEAK